MLFINQWGDSVDLTLSDSGKYSNGRTVLRAFDAEDGMPYMTISVNLVDEHLEDDEMFIKDYAENSGILSTLIKKGVVSKPVRWVSSGHVEIAAVKYLGIKHLQ